MRLAGKRAVVTGAAHGIGRATAARFLEEGAEVLLVDIDGDAGRCAASCLDPAHKSAAFVEADLADPAQVRGVFDAVRQRWDSLDILVNNAGVTWNQNPVDTEIEVWQRCLDTNLRSAWLCSREAVPLMDRAGGGSIVLVTSTHGHRTNPGFFPYTVSKAGMEGLMRSLAVEYGPRGVRANSIAPGMIRSRRTKEVLARYKDPEEAWRRILDSHPLRRLGTPEDVANAALFLASDESSFITGVTLFVDGGRNSQTLNLNGMRKD